MPLQNIPIDFVAYNADGGVVLLAEAKSRSGTSESWAAKLRRNMLAHGILPRSQYFLIATPEVMYGWRQEGLPVTEVPPQFTIDTKVALAPYFDQFEVDPANIGPEVFEFLIHTWLTDIAKSTGDRSITDPSLKPLSESGLLSSLQQAEIQMNATG